jgi:hypothetical protein
MGVHDKRLLTLLSIDVAQEGDSSRFVESVRTYSATSYAQQQNNGVCLHPLWLRVSQHDPWTAWQRTLDIVHPSHLGSQLGSVLGDLPAVPDRTLHDQGCASLHALWGKIANYCDPFEHKISNRVTRGS